MPNRWLKAAILTSARFNSVSMPAQSVFMRLLVVVDDHGRFDGRVSVLLSACDPLQTFARNCEQVHADATQKWFAGVLSELESVDLLRFWMAEKGPNLLIPRFYERPRSKSRFPDPPAELLEDQGCTHMLADVCKCELPTFTSSTTVHGHGARSTATVAKEQKDARAARLPPDFEMPQAWIGKAMGEQPTWTIDYAMRAARMFKNYWVAKSGKDAAKLDWEKTWENWVLKEGPMPTGAHAGNGSKQTALEQRNRAAAAEALRIAEENDDRH